jgi:UDP-2-acetamido-3-amino-2,3-dideoxy-glucuronate N-acetyltransferase
MTSDAPFVHASACVDEGVSLGAGAQIWHFCHVMDGARIGAGAMLGHACFVGRNVVIGERVRIQNHVSVFEGVELEADVFVGPSAVFSNVQHPRAAIPKRSEFRPTTVGRGATIGANATILPGVVLGEYCFVAAGAVVSKDVAPYALVMGVPARARGWVSRHGERLVFEAGVASCPVTGECYRLDRDRVSLSLPGA